MVQRSHLGVVIVLACTQLNAARLSGPATAVGPTGRHAVCKHYKLRRVVIVKLRRVVIGCSVFINKAGGVVRSGASRPLSHFRYGNRRSGAPNLGRRESEIVIE